MLLRLAFLAACSRALVCPPPCGPFCPMRSPAAVPKALDPKLEVLGASAPLISEQLASLTSDLEDLPAPTADFKERCGKLGSDLRALREDYADAIDQARCWRRSLPPPCAPPPLSSSRGPFSSFVTTANHAKNTTLGRRARRDRGQLVTSDDFQAAEYATLSRARVEAPPRG